MATFPRRLGDPDTTYAAYSTDRAQHTIATDADGIVRPRDEHEAAVADAHRLAVVTDPGEDAMPAKNASAADWVGFAVSQGMEPGEAAALSRAELIERFGDAYAPVATPDEPAGDAGQED